MKEHSKTESDLHRLEHEASTVELHQVTVDLRGENGDQADGKAELAPQFGLGSMMRFCPVLSSSAADISVSGLSAKLSKGICLAKANMVFDEGVHYWEIYCPIHCQQIQIGVSSNLQAFD